LVLVGLLVLLTCCTVEEVLAKVGDEDLPEGIY
jgi:hypothetical protein